MAKVRIMIVEDELLIAEEMAGKLESFGYSVVKIVDNATDARHALEVYQLDMLLIDIKLKGDEDGISLGTFVTQQYAVPLIYITSLTDQATIDRSKLSRPSAYLIKPYNNHQLQIAIDVALYNFSASRTATAVTTTNDEGNDHHVIREVFSLRIRIAMSGLTLTTLLILKQMIIIHGSIPPKPRSLYR